MNTANGAIRLARRLGLCAALLLAAVPAAQAAARLQLTIETRNTASPGSKNVPAGDTRQVDVMLAGNYISTAWDRRTTVFDFQRRRRLVLDEADRSYVDYSLYDVIGFRSAELAHRKKMAGAAAAAGIADRFPGLLADAHVLAVARAGDPAPVESADGTSWADDAGRPMAKRGPVLLEAAPEDVRAYAQLLRYAVGGHPRILAALAAGKGIPKQLVFHFRHAWGEGTKTVTVAAVQPLAKPPAYDLAGLKQRTPGSLSAADDLLDRAATLDAAGAEALRKRVRDEADAAWREGRVFQAYLGTVEGYLMTGVKSPAFTPQQLEQVRADASAKQLDRILAARTQEQFTQVLPLFAALHGPAGPKAYTLKLYEANDRVQVGELDTATQLFIDVLRANPALAGAYKDLGDTFFVRYDAARAWRSWDAGRRLAPAFGNFRKIDEFEGWLASEFAEYF